MKLRTSSSKQNRTTKDSTNLDFLRTVAVLCVFLAHVLHYGTGAYSDLEWHFGQAGVLMFFVHTSLVLMMSLERTTLTGVGLFGSFYVRRLFRIYPLSIFVVLMVFVTHFHPDIVQVWQTFSWADLVGNVTLTQNLFYLPNMVGVLWSLPLEVQMYLFLPPLFLLFRRGPLWRLLLLWASAGIFSIVFPKLCFGRLNVLGYAPCFIAGIIAWRLMSPQRQQLPGWLWPFAILAIGPTWFAASRSNYVYNRWSFCLLIGLAIPLFSEIPFAWLRPVSKTVAKYSYGIYLSHTFAMAIGYKWVAHQSSVMRWSVILLLAASFPILMYHLIEHPGIIAGQSIAALLFRPRKSQVVKTEEPVPLEPTETANGKGSAPSVA